MKDGPAIASVAALVGDPARANMLTALMDGRALTVTELAQNAGVGLPTASGHLARLVEAGLLTVSKQGRHRYLSLSGPHVAEVLESLMGLAERTGAARVRTGPKDAALRTARVCYDHLAGERGVALLDGLVARGVVTPGVEPKVTPAGEAFLARMGVDLSTFPRGRRPLCRSCLDWSERRAHLGGALGAALLRRILAEGWARRAEGRVIAFSPAGARAFAAAFSPGG